MSKQTRRAFSNNSTARFDGFASRSTGRGGRGDKVAGISPGVRFFSESELRSWYLSSGFIQTIVDAPAEDALREWISIKTNRDEDDPENGVEGLGISRLIENRMTELGVAAKLKDLIRFSRLYQNGGFLYFGVEAKKPQTDDLLKEPLPADLKRLKYLNVLTPEHIQVLEGGTDPLSSLFHDFKFHARGIEVHPSRLSWMVHSYMREERRGISVIDTILDAVLAQDTALWSVNHLVFEMAVKVFKSPKIDNLSPEKLAEFMAKMISTLSTQGAVALAGDEDFIRIQNGGVGQGMKELFDFIFENLAGLARMPKSRLMGNSQGVITAGQYDNVNYYDGVAKFQELELRPIIEKIIGLVVNERDGDIFKALGGDVSGLDWEFEFNPLWRSGPLEQAEINLKGAQENQIYITTGVLSPGDVKSMRFKELEEFESWSAPALDFTAPALPEPFAEKKPEKTGTEETAATAIKNGGF